MTPETIRTRAIQVKELVRVALGEKVQTITHLDFGHRSLTFDVASPGRSVIVRTHSDARIYAKTADNMVTLASLGLPVSRVIAADLTLHQFRFAYLVLEKIPGRDLRDGLAAMTPTQMTRLAEQVVEFQQRVMALPAGGGFGYAPLGETGPYASLWDLLHYGETATAGVMEPRLAVLIQSRADYFRQARPVCFLDDITVKNVIVQNGELQGLIDFDTVCYGDPLFWLGLTATVVASDLGGAGNFYVDELRRLAKLTDDEQRLVALYAAWISLGFIRKFGTTASAVWRTHMAAARERWLDEVEA